MCIVITIIIIRVYVHLKVYIYMCVSLVCLSVRLFITTKR